MKITISLSDAEVKGIKQYLKVDCDIEHPTKKDIEQFVSSYVNAINSPRERVSDFIKKFI